MILCIADVLAPEAVARLRARLAEARFVDGRATAGWHARMVKHNRQVDAGEAALGAMQKTVAEALAANALFAMAARPKIVRPVLFSRYEPGMEYGSHVDDAVMGGMRTDLSFTLFLSDPADYDGGELVIEGASGEEDIRLPAGSLVLYPSTALHRVAPVTRGERLVAVSWVRSLIRDPAAREILFDLDTARQSLYRQNGKTAEFDLLSKTLSNLLRRWVED